VLRLIRSSKSGPFIEVHVAVLLISFTSLLVKLLNFSLVSIALFRAVFAAIFLGFVMLYFKPVVRVKNKRHLFLLIIIGVIQALFWLSYFKSILVSTAAIGVMCIYTAPAFLMFLEPLFFKECYRVENFFVSILIFSGVVMASPSIDMNDSIFEGVLWGLLGAFLLSVMTLMDRSLVKSYSSLTITFYRTAFSGLTLLPFFISEGFDFYLEDLSILLLLGIVATAIPFVLLVRSLRVLRGQQVFGIMSLEVVYAMIFAALFLTEIPPLRTVLGAVVILGVTLYMTLKRKKDRFF
jgi:drug/metabolite transporter (DMT)-like permease